MAEITDRTAYYHGAAGILSLWFAVLAGPLAWALGLNLEYSLVLVACARGTMLPLHLVSLGTLLVAGAGAAAGWREWGRSRGGDAEGGGTLDRSRFMAALGILSGGYFALVIVAQWIANLFLNPCMGI